MLNLDLAQFRTAGVSGLMKGAGDDGTGGLGGVAGARGRGGKGEGEGELSVGSSRVFYGNGCTTWRSS